MKEVERGLVRAGGQNCWRWTLGDGPSEMDPWSLDAGLGKLPRDGEADGLEMDPRRWTLRGGLSEPGCWSQEVAQGWSGSEGAQCRPG